jgi:hypothetical protein
MRYQWFMEKKSFGYDSTNIRISSIIAQLEERARQLSEYLNGERPQLEELEEEALPFYKEWEAKSPLENSAANRGWTHVMTNSIIRTRP